MCAKKKIVKSKSSLKNSNDSLVEKFADGDSDAVEIAAAERKAEKLSSFGSKVKKSQSVSAPHVIVLARAGTGKTTTLIEGLKQLKGQKSKLTPSPQQKAVWDSIALSKNEAKTVAFVAFNKSIATELQERVPSGCDAMTNHSLGNKAVRAAFGNLKLNNYRVQNLIEEITGKDIRELRKNDFTMIKAVESLVGLCKMNLTDLSVNPVDELSQLAAHYDIELNGSFDKVCELVPKILERCKEVTKDRSFDFNDMIWLPVALNLPVSKYDLLLVDEAQDLNRCQQALLKTAGKRLIFCGDDRQAIYGFAGADAESLNRLQEELSATPAGCQVLPLTVTRRCGKLIVKEANTIVADFEAFETNCEGQISQDVFDNDSNPQKTYRAQVKEGDMLLCRVNAPLVSQCFKFIREGRKANIQGRDIGQGLIATVNKLMKGYSETGLELDIVELCSRLSDWKHAEERKENAKRIPSESRLIALQDRYDCLLCFTEGKKTIQEVIDSITDIFTDEKGNGIRLSSIHKAKGLEADRVFLLEPKSATVPHPMAKSDWQIQQEWNLRYVAITRAIRELIYVK